jgi:rubrerythrin
MTKPLNKKKLMYDFNMMRDFEISARDQYLEMSANPIVQKAGLGDQFKLISQEENKHIKVVETILGLIEKL